MKRAPEKPLHAVTQDKRETWAFFGLMFAGFFIAYFFLEDVEMGTPVIKRITQVITALGSVFFADAVKKKMAKEYDEKVRVWLNYWDEYKEETDRLKHSMDLETDTKIKDTMRIKVENRNDFYNKNFY